MFRTLFWIAFLLPATYGKGTGNIAGTVQDEAEAVPPRAAVTATRTETARPPTPVTDEARPNLASNQAPASLDVKADFAGDPQLQTGGGREVPPPAKRSPHPFGVRVGEVVEMGGRVFLRHPAKADRGKFEEYRDIPRGLFLEGLHLRLESTDQSFLSEIRARGVREEDQNLLFRTSKLGRYDASFEWDQIPHIFSSTGRSLYRETRRGVIALDDKIQSAVQAAPGGLAKGALLEQFLAGAREVDLSSRWDVGRFVLKQTPTPKWDVRYEYTRTRKEGNRPIGSLTGSSNEVPEPIEHTIHDVQATAGLTRDQWQVQFAYNVSVFQNDLESLVWDSPLQLDDTAFSGPGRSRFALAPSNVAHTGSITGALNLPRRSRLVGTFSYGLRLQDDKFIPHTINSAISSPDLALPAESLNGEVHTRLFNLQFTSRPVSSVSLRARYRVYDYNDRSPALTFPAWVNNDSTLMAGETGRVTASRFTYTKHAGAADVGWRLFTPLSLKVGYDWERWTRDERVREVPVSDEHTPKVSLDYDPFDWLLLRASYTRSWRRIDRYHPYAHLASVVSPAEFARLVPNGTVQSPLLRKYDEADRDRNGVDVLAQLSPGERLTFTPTVSFRKDSYSHSYFGLQGNTSKAAGIDVSWSPTEGATVFASYMREEFRADQRSRYRPSGGVDNSRYDWVGRNNDLVDTFGGGLDAPLIPEKLDFHVVWNYSLATGKMLAFNPVPPSGGTAFQNADARAMDFPDIKDSTQVLEASIRFRFKKGWFAKIGYVFEKFRFSDFRTDDLRPYMGDIDELLAQRAVFLGAQTRPYKVHMLAFTYGYRF